MNPVDQPSKLAEVLIACLPVVGTVAHPASIGVTPKEYLDKMLAEPFESFTFSPAGAAVYQLGPRIYVARPNRPVVGADWGMRFAVTLLFPK